MTPPDGIELPQAMVNRIALLENTLQDRHVAAVKDVRDYFESRLTQDEKLGGAHRDSIKCDIESVRSLVATLSDLIDAKILTVESRIASHALLERETAAAAEKAIQKAELATEKRFESVNEFRQQLVDQSQTFATKETVQAQLDVSAKDRGELRGSIEAIRLDMKEVLRPASLTLIQNTLDAHRDAFARIDATYATKDTLDKLHEQSVTDRNQLRDSINELRIQLQSVLRPLDLDPIRAKLDEVRAQQARILNQAMGASLMLTLIGTLIAVIFRVTGH